MPDSIIDKMNAQKDQSEQESGFAIVIKALMDEYWEVNKDWHIQDPDFNARLCGLVNVLPEVLNDFLYSSRDSARELGQARVSAMHRNMCDAFGIYYYSRPHEDFDVAEGVRLALTKNCKFIVFDDLS